MPISVIGRLVAGKAHAGRGLPADSRMLFLPIET
jgi:hypothetical protein